VIAPHDQTGILAETPLHLPKEAFKRHTIDELWRVMAAT
jgi:hypothetical protein